MDEYDTALTENLDRLDVLRDILDVLRAFYGALKSSTPYIAYTLVTGITRLAHAGLFSGANHLHDLSHRSTVNSLLGFTSAELRTPPVAALVAQGARNLGCTSDDLYTALEQEYHGYRFAEGAEAVCNPYTLAGCLAELAQPDAMVHWNLQLLRGLQGRRVHSLPALEGQAARPWMQVAFDAGKPPVVALLWQVGYLTLDAVVPPALTFPNREVRAAFAESLVEWLAETAPTWLAESGLPRLSMVSELAPVVLFLRGVMAKGDLLLMEEPEAHLHPAAQTQMAQQRGHMVRAGLQVVITTHSDWLLKEIGNLMREGELAEETWPNATQDSPVLRPEEVGIWLFRKDTDATASTVEEIPFDRTEGIEPQDYEDVAAALYNRSAQLQNRLEETEGGSHSAGG